MESRSDGENDGEEESRLLTDPRSGMSSWIKDREVNIGEIEEATKRKGTSVSTLSHSVREESLHCE